MISALEKRKLNIIEYLAELNDEGLLLQIENLLQPKVDFWDALSEKDKAVIRQGEKDLNEGKRIAFSDFLAQRRQKP
jgi:predicted NAD/FAD-binding protein